MILAQNLTTTYKTGPISERKQGRFTPVLPGEI
jgi:hypothetical protein